MVRSPIGRQGSSAASRDRKKALSGRLERLAIIEAIIDFIIAEDPARSRFLLVGHAHPDEDCVASLVAFALVLQKLGKRPVIHLKAENRGHFEYLTKICQYNLLPVLDEHQAFSGGYDGLFVFDTPKPDMLESLEAVAAMMDSGIRTVEIDHHLEADGQYIGDPGYRLVDEASSTCELIAVLALRLNLRKDLLDVHKVSELFSRNFILAVITGMVGDSKRGEYLKSEAQKRHFAFFSRIFDGLLSDKTAIGSGNLSTLEEILEELERLNSEERQCYNAFRAFESTDPGLHWAVLDEDASREMFAKHDEEVVVTAAKYAADAFAEDSGRLGLIGYIDPPELSPYLQLRLRRSRKFKELDLRDVLGHLGIENGGGHEGAVGFRVPAAEVGDPVEFVRKTARSVEELLP